jgi:H/ACA ribonucleoprotein complex non-core subunit NAF1
MEAEGGSDDEGDRAGKSGGNAQVRTKNEVTDEPVTKPDVMVTEDMKIEELGSIQNIVEGTALIMAITPGEYQVLDTGSVLCTAERVVIGAVAETIGKVLQPMYTVRFSSPTEPAELGLQNGTKIFYPVDHANYVFTEPLKNLKGSDASNIHDEEVGDEEMEFSDDEKEAEYKRSLKQKKRDRARGGAAAKGKEPHPLRQEMQTDGGLNYDDDEDGPYKPLTRPPGFGSGPVSTETYDPRPRGGFRGGRGEGRGRGGRGRGGRGGRGGSGGQREGHSLPPQGAQQQQQFAQASNTPAQWGAQAQAPPPPAVPGFGFQVPGWPQPPPPGSGAVPPPPPGWPAQGQAGQAQPNPAFNPAVFAALLSQMQQAQQGGGQQGWGGQQPPPAPGQ